MTTPTRKLPDVRCIAYFTNQYPKVSHAFIRRELLEIEKQGVRVMRYSVRPTPDQLVDPADEAENEKTQVLLESGLGALTRATVEESRSNPARFARAMQVALQAGGKSTRGRSIHLIYLGEACLLKQWAERDGVQHIHAHFGTNPAMVAMLCRVLGGPTYSYTVHGPDEFDRAAALNHAEKARHASFVVAITDFCRSQLFRWVDYRDWPKIKVVHCGLDEKFLEQKTQPAPDNATFVCVGRLCEQKGQMLLVRAAAELKRRGRDFRIVFVGDGDMREDVEGVIARNDLHDQIVITGWASSDQVIEHLQSCRALVLSSFAEGLPVVIMEAFALARPVISTYIAGIPELVKNGENGWLTYAGDEEGLVEVLEDCLTSPIERIHALGEQAKADVQINHDIRVEAGRLLEHIRDAIAEDS